MLGMILLRRIIRPLIPNALMAWLRHAQQSRSARSNVDVWVTRRLEQLRWMVFSPDTYRVGRQPATAVAPNDWQWIGEQKPAPPLAWSKEDPVIHARSSRPTMPSSLRISEPSLHPISIAFPPHYGIPQSTDLVHIQRDLHAAGIRYQVVVETPYVDAIAHPTRAITGNAVIVVSAVPLHDIGGGSRGAQLAHAFLSAGLSVIYVAAFQAQETDDLGIRYEHPMLEQWTLAEFNVEQIRPRLRGEFSCLLSIPSEAAIETATAIKNAGGRLIYDLIDDWDDPGLGGDWFSPRAEAELVELADHIICSAGDLVERIASISTKTAVLVPNAVNEQVFGRKHTDPVPADWPAAEDDLVLGYHGSLYGSWLDWDSIRSVARAFPTAPLILIGDPKGVPDDLPDNIVFLGLKEHSTLPAYVRRFSVGLLPFQVSSTTHAVSPLKVYEYLASGVPVAAPNLRSLTGVEGVSTADQLTDAVQQALQGPRPDADEALRLHGWSGRVASITSLLGWTTGQGAPASISLRVATHYPRTQRSLE